MNYPKKQLSLEEVRKKIENFCSYQERCHEEVKEKLHSFSLTANEIDQLLVHLLEDNFLNEERFACSFARGKHRIKHWGKIRIVNELKHRKISAYTIDLALKEISNEEYQETLFKVADRHWQNLTEQDIQKRRSKFCDYLLRKGFESNLVYEQLKYLEAKEKSQENL